MNYYEFDVAIHGDAFAAMDELYEAGCDDATFFRVDGACYGSFSRPGPSLIAAVETAKRDVESVPGLRARFMRSYDSDTA